MLTEPERLKGDSTKKGKRIFEKPKTEKEVAQAKLSAIPAKTLIDLLLWVKAFHQ